MQSDEVIWGAINNNFCSFKVKAKTQNFCRNEYNVTGFCSRQSCPLANSQYATIKEVDGKCYLYIKTIERAHSPAKMWERVKLSKNYAEALKQIDKELMYWNKFTIHKCKQRLTKITQYLMKMRRLATRTQTKLVGVKKKIERREASRELKAEAAAKLEQTIQKELLTRLKDGVYGKLYDDIVNIDSKAFENVMEELGESDDETVREFVEADSDLSDMEEMEQEEDEMQAEEDDSSGDEEMRELARQIGAGKKRGPRVEIEYEHEPVETEQFKW